MQFIQDNFGAISAIALLIIMVICAIKREGDYPVVRAESAGTVPPPTLTYDAPGEESMEILIDDQNYAPDPRYKIYHGTPYYDALVEIYIFRLFRIGRALDLCFTDSIAGAKKYAGLNGYIVEFYIPADIQLIRTTQAGELRAGVPDAEEGDYIIFDDRTLSSNRIYDGNGKALTDQNYAQRYLEANLS
jgi:hypothetical protein